MINSDVTCSHSQCTQSNLAGFVVVVFTLDPQLPPPKLEHPASVRSGTGTIEMSSQVQQKSLFFRRIRSYLVVRLSLRTPGSFLVHSKVEWLLVSNRK